MSFDAVLSDWFGKIDRDLAYLSTCFREVLEELGEGDLVSVLPWCGANGDACPLPDAEAQASGRDLQVVSIAFQLLNLIEENAANQARRYRESTQGILQEPGTWGQNLRQLRESGFSAEALAERLRNVHVEVVLTAHPTEAKRPTVLKQHRALFESLELLENPIWTANEREAVRRKIKVVMERVWRTGEMYLVKPDVEHELSNMLEYFRAVFPRVVPALDQRLKDAWREAGFDPSHLEKASSLPQLTFGNWVGGDRDGHPLVTPEVTRNALGILRRTAIESMRNHLQGIYESLSLSDLFQQPPPELVQAVEDKIAQIGFLDPHLELRTPHEPWRRYIGCLMRLLPSEDCKAERPYTTSSDLGADLQLLRDSLVKVGAERLAEAELAPLMRLVQSFGFHTAALDIRQNSAFHDRALEELFQSAGIDANGFSSWPEERRRELLERELESPRPLSPRNAELGEYAKNVIETYQVIADHMARYGKRGIGAFIVSMTRDVSDLLAVYVLAREVGLVHPTEEGLVSEVEVVPLFETVDDLRRGPEVLRQFLQHPITRSSLRTRRNGTPLHQVMVGYSDSNKGSGILASHWYLNRAQQALAEVGRELGITVLAFHGRGGTVSRGAGPTHRFLESLPHGSLTDEFRLTEQGETIGQKYSNLPTAQFNLELLMAGVMATTCRHHGEFTEDDRANAICERLSETSREAYQALLAREDFLPFWSEATPIDALEQSFIGSRPARRTGRRTLDDLRAIPWVFSWTQARYYVPGWFGVGSALERLQQESPDDYAYLQQRIKQLSFLRYVLYNAETSLASADVGLMEEYASLVQDEGVRTRNLEYIVAEYRRSETMVNAIFGASRETRRPRMIKTLKMREEGLRFLHRRQISLLKSWRKLLADGKEAEAATMVPALLLSINAIASGERTTG